MSARKKSTRCAHKHKIITTEEWEIHNIIIISPALHLTTHLFVAGSPPKSMILNELMIKYIDNCWRLEILEREEKGELVSTEERSHQQTPTTTTDNTRNPLNKLLIKLNIS